MTYIYSTGKIKFDEILIQQAKIQLILKLTIIPTFLMTLITPIGMFFYFIQDTNLMGIHITNVLIKYFIIPNKVIAYLLLMLGFQWFFMAEMILWLPLGQTLLIFIQFSIYCLTKRFKMAAKSSAHKNKRYLLYCQLLILRSIITEQIFTTLGLIFMLIVNLFISLSTFFALKVYLFTPKGNFMFLFLWVPLLLGPFSLMYFQIWVHNGLCSITKASVDYKCNILTNSKHVLDGKNDILSKKREIACPKLKFDIGECLKYEDTKFIQFIYDYTFNIFITLLLNYRN